MKKQFSLRRNSYQNTYRGIAWRFSGFIAAAVVLILLFIIHLAMPQLLVAMATPVWKEGTNLDAGVGTVFSGFSSKADLEKENSALSDEVTTLQNQNAVLTARSQDLTKLLGGNTQNTDSNILAGVLARPPTAAYDTLLVAAGSADGVSIDAEAFAKGDIPIGTVRSTTMHSSVIELFSNGGRSTDGWVGSNRTPLTLIGGGAGTYSSTLPKGASVIVGDEVYVSGPGALPIGTVAKIDADPSSPTVVIHVQPSVNLFSIPWIEIAPAP